MKNISVSIITVVYNNRDGIKKTLESMARQTYLSIEYIVVDGGSTDGTKEILSSHSSIITKWISEPDKGIYDAMNKGLGLANGDLIGIINSGDFYENDTIASVVAFYHKYPEAAIFHGILRVFEASGEFKAIIGNHNSFLNKGMIEHPTCFVKREIYQQYGVFDTGYHSSADYDFMLRMRKLKVNFLFIEKIMANYFAGGVSSQKKALLETLKIKERHGLISKFKRVVIETIIILRTQFKL